MNLITTAPLLRTAAPGTAAPAWGSYSARKPIGSIDGVLNFFPTKESVAEGLSISEMLNGEIHY